MSSMYISLAFGIAGLLVVLLAVLIWVAFRSFQALVATEGNTRRAVVLLETQSRQLAQIIAGTERGAAATAALGEGLDE